MTNQNKNKEKNKKLFSPAKKGLFHEMKHRRNKAFYPIQKEWIMHHHYLMEKWISKTNISLTKKIDVYLPYDKDINCARFYLSIESNLELHMDISSFIPTVEVEEKLITNTILFQNADRSIYLSGQFELITNQIEQILTNKQPTK